MILSRTTVLLLASLVSWIAPPLARAHHRARLDPTEPIFTERSFVERNLELDTLWEKRASSNGITLSPSFTWVFWKWRQLDLEVPAGIEIPRGGATVGSLGDVSTAAQAMLCCEPNQLLDYLSLRLEVEAPTGNRAKGIGGTGSWGVSVLPGRLFTVLESLPDLFVQAELGYGEALRPSQDALDAAAASGGPAAREKAAVWNVAFAQQYLAGRLRPVFEMLGTSTIAGAPGDEGTIVELASGMWVAPFPDEQWLSPVSIGLGWKWPVTSRRDTELTGLLILEWAFDA
jgi:hypothetical protein